ncbi:MAG: reverse transcriptase/maturase family protein [Bacilli bacterium]|jgi:hypothetical protein
MKRHGNLFSQIVGYENIVRSHQQARRGKAHYQEVQMVDKNPQYFCEAIQRSLEERTFRTSQYTTKRIFEPKERLIYKLPYYPDRIVHHAVMNVIQPIWDRVFIPDLYSAIPGKGLHKGSYRLRQFMRDVEGTRYCLKFDIKQYYPSVDHDILLALIQRKIKCKGTLWLLEEVVNSADGHKNVPIGNYLSQYFGNIYLNWFDHWIKEDLGRDYYLRYCDDGVILGSDKMELLDLREQIREYLATNLDLTLNKKTTLLKVDVTGIDFLGYRHFRDYTLLRKSSAQRFKKKIRYIEENHAVMRPQTVVSSVMSYLGWLQHCDSHNLVEKYVYQNPKLVGIMDSASEDLGIKNPLFQ